MSTRDDFLSAVPPRLYPLRPAPPQQVAYARSRARFNVVPAGRRSGKTERFKRKLVRCALTARGPDPRFFAGAPTRDQAKRIYWKDLKAMFRRDLMAGAPSESELVIRLINGAEVHVVGMDKPERIEGSPWDGGGLDEYGNMKPQAFDENVFPALADRNGWCDLIGVPEGRNHYYDKWKYAISGADPDWAGFTWFSSEVLPPAQIETMRRSMDELTFRQECEGSFVSFEGRAYYAFSDEHCAPLTYRAEMPLVFCFDFNVDPGVAAVIQEQHLPNGMPDSLTGTGVIGEVYIPQNSNTAAVCRKLVQDWGFHPGYVLVYGDATGGGRRTVAAQPGGNDWDMVQAELYPTFGDRLMMRVGASNPSERARINAVNSRIRTATGEEWLMVDPAKAPNVVKDFEGVRLLQGGSGEIDKKADLRLSHLTDAIGYYVVAEFPVIEPHIGQRDMF